MSEIGEITHGISDQWAALEVCWHDAAQQWRDPVSDQFRREFWRQWEETLPATLRALSELDAAIDQAMDVLSEDEE